MRKELKRLGEKIDLQTQWASRKSIEEITAYISSQPPEYLRQAANPPVVLLSVPPVRRSRLAAK
jgi:hypothetical protein